MPAIQSLEGVRVSKLVAVSWNSWLVKRCVFWKTTSKTMLFQWHGFEVFGLIRGQVLKLDKTEPGYFVRIGNLKDRVAVPPFYYCERQERTVFHVTDEIAATVLVICLFLRWYTQLSWVVWMGLQLIFVPHVIHACRTSICRYLVTLVLRNPRSGQSSCWSFFWEEHAYKRDHHCW